MLTDGRRTKSDDNSSPFGSGELKKNSENNRMKSALFTNNTLQTYTRYVGTGV